MANAAAATATDSNPEPKAANGKKKIVIIAGIVVLLLIGGGAWYFLSHKTPAADAKTAEQPAHKHVVYLPLDTFTVNLRDADQERFLQVTINLELSDAATGETIKKQMPAVRNRVLLLLSSKTSEELLPREGKEKLSVEIAAELHKMLDGADPGKSVEQVLFSHFVIQ